MKNSNLKQLTHTELNAVNGGGWAFDLGHAVGDFMCGIACAMDAAYGYFEGSPSSGRTK